MQVMADLVADKLGADAGTVLAAMLSHGRRFETTVQVGSVEDPWMLLHSLYKLAVELRRHMPE
jgi:hypothetical protein